MPGMMFFASCARPQGVSIPRLATLDGWTTAGRRCSASGASVAAVTVTPLRREERGLFVVRCRRGWLRLMRRLLLFRGRKEAARYAICAAEIGASQRLDADDQDVWDRGVDE